MHGPPAERIQTMHHVPEICVGKACSPDESTFSPGSSGTMQSKKTTQSKTHFRTIAPKVAPKVVSPCPSSFPPSVADITTSNAKPFIMQTQNYALMKVTGQDGTISLVALPQVTPSMGGQVIQTTGIPLQENLKLPIPRYQPSRVKKSLNKKSRVLNKTKFEKIAVGKIEDNQESFMIPDTKEATIPHSTSMTAVEEAVSECGMFPGSGAQVVNVCNSALPLIDKAAGFILPSTSPTKLNVDLEKVGLGESGTAVKCNSSKVADSANPGVLSPVVFGSPVHLISNVPQGKLPILPYSKIKKSILSNCKQSTDPSSSSKLNVALCGMQTSPGDTWASPSSVSISQIPTPGGPYQPVPKHDGDLNQQNGVPGKKRGKKRKALNEILGYQTKIRPLGNKLIVSKEKIKSQAAEASDKKTAVVKKYRNIMPKPFVDIQDLASFSGSCVKESLTGESMLRNRLINVRTPKWRQCETFPVVKNDCKIPSSAKLLYNCHICDHSFQFKHHLQDHLNSHSNKRPYHCRLCRKAYVHSGSLSTHMKLHHSDSRLKKLMCCEFCAKVFGHIRVYFGHLKEVHKVIISTELSAKQVERKKQTHKDEANILDGDGNGNEDDVLQGQTDEIRLQIKCGRCHFITPTFSDMKLHLFCVHGDEFKEILQDGILENRQGAQEEVVKHATHHWKLLNERRNVVKCYKCDEDFFGSSRLRRHVCASDSIHSQPNENEVTPLVEGQPPLGRNEDLPSGFCAEIKFCCGNVFNCLLCKQVFEVQSELFEHWEMKHNCDDPLVLWTIFSSFAKNDAKQS